jgi:hypothetical protein
MFHEIDPELIKQSSPHSIKRWFRDAEAECDLFLWQDGKNKLQRFQFRYQDALIEWDQIKGIRTGHIDALSGSFIHYQSKLFRLHQDLDLEIIQGVRQLLNNKEDDLQDGMRQIHEILYEIAARARK